MSKQKTEDQRLFPSIFHSRRYPLIKLRKEIALITKKYIVGSEYNTLLDYGSGEAPYKPFFKQYISNYIAADIEASVEDVMKLNSDGSIPAEANSIDIVLSTQVLEHVEEPTLYLSEANRVLRKDGLLILSTHGYWIFHPSPNDYWRWTSQGLRRIIEERGFEVVSFRGIMNRSAVGVLLIQDHFAFKLPIVLRQIFTMFMQMFIWIFDKSSGQKTRDRDAGIFVVAARKK